MSLIAADHPATTTRFRLRETTGALHRATERKFALERRIATRAGYRDLLAALYGFYAPMETALGAIEWGEDTGLTERFCKALWLCNDLAALGLSPAAIDALPRADIPVLPSRAAALGALYVLEGATLGGQLIIKELKQSLGVERDTGGRFFSSYGDSIGTKWRAFVTALDRHDSDSVAIEHAAIETFMAFGSWLPPVPAVADD